MRADGWGLGVALVAALVVSGCSSAAPGSIGADHPVLPVKSAAPSLPAPASSTAAVTPPGRPAFDPQSVTFVSASTGWAWGPAACCSLQELGPGVLARTQDGGRSWAVVPTPGIDFAGMGLRHSGVDGVRFIDAEHGYLFGTQLFATADGGRSWVRRPIPHPILDLEAGAGVAYATVLDCWTASCSSFHLYRLAADGAVLTRLRPAGNLNGASTDLVLQGPVVYLLTNSPQDHPGALEPVMLWRWAGVGAWQRSGMPCADISDESAALAAWSDNGLAAVCGSEPGAGNQLKWAYSSSDGGQHWTYRGRLPGSSGYVASLAARAPAPGRSAKPAARS